MLPQHSVQDLYILHRGEDDEDPLVVALWVNGEEEEARPSGIIPLGIAKKNLIVGKLHLHLLSRKTLRGEDLLLHLIHLSSEISDKKDGLKLGYIHLMAYPLQV